MGNEVMVRGQGKAPRRFEVKARVLRGDAEIAQLALEHTLLWREWKSLLVTQNQQDVNLIDLHKRMAELDGEMRACLERFNKVIGKRERRVEKHG